jgi:hypothetical protein
MTDHPITRPHLASAPPRQTPKTRFPLERAASGSQTIDPLACGSISESARTTGDGRLEASGGATAGCAGTRLTVESLRETMIMCRNGCQLESLRPPIIDHGNDCRFQRLAPATIVNFNDFRRKVRKSNFHRRARVYA